MDSRYREQNNMGKDCVCVFSLFVCESRDAQKGLLHFYPRVYVMCLIGLFACNIYQGECCNNQYFHANNRSNDFME